MSIIAVSHHEHCASPLSLSIIIFNVKSNRQIQKWAKKKKKKEIKKTSFEVETCD